MTLNEIISEYKITKNPVNDQLIISKTGVSGKGITAEAISTIKANKTEIIAILNSQKINPKHQETCTRCNANVDTETASWQWEMDHGRRVKAYYCQYCSALLNQIGTGERTAMQDRAAGYSPEHEHKQD